MLFQLTGRCRASESGGHADFEVSQIDIRRWQTDRSHRVRVSERLAEFNQGQIARTGHIQIVVGIDECSLQGPKLCRFVVGREIDGTGANLVHDADTFHTLSSALHCHSQGYCQETGKLKYWLGIFP